MNNQLIPGTWIYTEPFGKAVVLSVFDNWVNFRYEAVRCSNGKTIWAQNALPIVEVSFLSAPDAKSIEVLNLKGPYGEDG